MIYAGCFTRAVSPGSLAWARQRAGPSVRFVLFCFVGLRGLGLDLDLAWIGLDWDLDILGPKVRPFTQPRPTAWVISP
jgi:hypothetical protein